MDLKTVEDWKSYYRQKFLTLNTPEKNKNNYQQSYPKNLPHEAWCKEIAQLPLGQQCLKLGITHEKINDFSYGKKPEIDALNHFSAQGFVGAYCEGGPILLLIRAAALDVFAQFSCFSRNHACTGFTEAQLTMYRESSELILNTIRNTNETQVVRHLEEIYMSPLIPRDYPGLTAEIASSLFAAIGAERLAQIAAAIMEDPYKYRSGWPDLTMAKGADMLWVEIKTTDRLNANQIMTISRMKLLLPGNLRVVQLSRSKPKKNVEKTAP